ncbi:ABC-three component system protein [Shewanella sp. MBTL60-007]|uniref:ABC-three component system protein n=1 Tax=Shewanella sp. MBTL60-007 TaxID=2815911 RepID=UPI001BC76F91|nr:ABC-three component system protein [Shewanella sp. MBTL60-007]GIU20064.1 hypothetical protein TUM3792_18460 [Shewanella sp. MBTL60-007]
MTMYELMSAHCVMVNDGSGVIVDAMTDKYSYVLTAKHVLKEQNTITNYLGEPIKIINIHKHDSIDCAIVLIEPLSDIQQHAWPASSIEHHSPLMVTGFPKTRRESQEKIKQQDGKFTTITDESFVFTAEGIPPKELINGMSGSGVYYLYNQKSYLIGIEHSMDGDKDIEMYGRLKCVSLLRFNEIISSKTLAPMAPYFLESFSRIKDKVFGFNVIKPDNVKKLKEKLEQVVHVVQGHLPAPYDLMLKYDKTLLLANENPSVLQDKELWVAYFEFVIICALIDEVKVVDNAYLKRLERKRRIIHSSTDKHWVRELADILKAAKQMLDRKGVIVVNSFQENAPLQPPLEHLAEVIDDISSIPSHGDILQIDNVNEDTYKTFTVTHLKGLRNYCVVEKEWEYGKALPSEQLAIFKRYYSEIIK